MGVQSFRCDGAGSLDLAVAFMRSSSSMIPARDGRYWFQHGVVKSGEFCWKITNVANRSFRFLFACSFSFKGLCVVGDILSSKF
jgi:hypothetical protein